MFRIKFNTIIEAIGAIVASMIVILFLGGNTFFDNGNKMKSIELITSYPVSLTQEKGKLQVYYLTDTISIFYSNDYILYRLSPKIQFETNINIKNTEPYFIYNKKNNYGFLFNSINDKTPGVKLKVDSFLTTNGKRGKGFDTPPDTSWKLVSSFKDKNYESLVELYAPIKIPEEADFDSIGYYFTKNIKDIDFSFSKKLDSIKGMKLYKIRLIYNEKMSTQYKMIIPKREFLFEIKEASESIPPEISEFIDKFKKGQ